VEGVSTCRPGRGKTVTAKVFEGKSGLSRHSSCDDVSPALIRLTKEIACSVKKKQPPSKA
jgi:hypothetical protein